MTTNEDLKFSKLVPLCVKNSFHLVQYSPWPLYASCGAGAILRGFVLWFRGGGMSLFFLGLLLVSAVAFLWWGDVTAEATYIGCHTTRVASGLRIGMGLFIIREVCFFFSFFWAFFQSSLAPELWVGSVWPTIGVVPLDHLGVPLLNTVVLLRRGVTLTWAHHSIISGLNKQARFSLLFTCVLGVYFTWLQGNEYAETSFSIRDGAYGRCFFVATGFHGFHVLVGTTALVCMLFRIWLVHFSTKHHVGFECRCWYWHFVDVV